MFFGWFRFGLISLWLALIVILCALLAAFSYTGNVTEAQYVLLALAGVLVSWISYTAGRFKGVELGQSLAIEPLVERSGIDRTTAAELQKDFLIHREECLDFLVKKIVASISSPPSVSPKGKTAKRLADAIENFPRQYPEYSARPPKLDEDVRQWLKTAYGSSEREAHVFGVIIAEHFGF